MSYPSLDRRSRRRGPPYGGAFSVVFSPLSFFTSGEQGAWYDPSDLTTLFQDSAGTIPVAVDGDPVGLMMDKSGNGNNVSQPISAARPVYKTLGGLHWIQADGIDDHMPSNILPAAKTQPTSIVVGFRDDNALGSNIYVFDDVDSTSRQALTAVNTDNLWYSYAGTAKSSHPRIQNNSVIDILFNGASSKSSINGGVFDVGNYGSNGFKSIRLFAQYSTSLFLQGRFYGGVWVEGDIGDDNRTIVRQYMASKSGVTL